MKHIGVDSTVPISPIEQLPEEAGLDWLNVPNLNVPASLPPSPRSVSIISSVVVRLSRRGTFWGLLHGVEWTCCLLAIPLMGEPEGQEIKGERGKLGMGQDWQLCIHQLESALVELNSELAENSTYSF